METPVVERIVTVVGEHGLHLRPAERFSRLAMSFESEIEVVCDGVCVDAKSIINVLTLGAAPGAELRLKASGADANEAVDALVRLVQSDFDHQQITSRGAAADGSP
ncbi:MAG: HPr family phosphocarrier protein [Planctomycetales bacterium]|nr:HPr family phosphocarrier protein [Planctomycetales bacterium]